MDMMWSKSTWSILRDLEKDERHLTMTKKEPVAQFVKQQETPVNVLLFIADQCNFSCPYCYNRRPRTNKIVDLDLLYKFVLDASKKTQRRMNITLIGGEPTLHPSMMDFCKALIKDVPRSCVEILTNFSQPLDYYLGCLDLGMKIAATWHGKCNDKANLDYCKKMLRVPMKFFENDQIEVRIMFENDNWENAEEVFKQMYPLFKRWVEISLVSDLDGKPYPYTKEQLDRYRELLLKLKYTRDFFTIRYDDGSEKQVSFNDMYLNPLVNFHLWRCNAGLDYIYVHCNGNVYNCQSYYEHDRKPICNIIQTAGEYKQELFKPTICQVEYCSCDFDVYKEKILKI